MSKDLGNLKAIKDAIDKIFRIAGKTPLPLPLFEDEIRFDAVLMNFIVIGEMAARISENTRNLSPKIRWSEIKGFRNIIAHNYFGVDPEEVCDIITNHLPELYSEICRLIKILTVV
ncbi:MAG TPA: DUF86 domain-containing protein [Candidatus Rifleibacterium sp.]|nr:DUF86 domain-containing protein [Candidatus Rifleibacterium sp.]HPT46418.1 DUF86 domain-containing protein [Candidatus Rifleibacterium sp.]